MSAPSTKRSIAILKTSDDRVSISIQESDGQSRHMMAQIELSIQDAELLAGDIMKSVEAIRRRAR